MKNTHGMKIVISDRLASQLTPEAIEFAEWMMSTPEGREVAREISEHMVPVKIGKHVPLPKADMGD